MDHRAIGTPRWANQRSPCTKSCFTNVGRVPGLKIECTFQINYRIKFKIKYLPASLFFQFTLIIAFVLIILIFSAFLKEAVSLSYTESGTGIEKTDTCNNQKHSLKTCHKIRGVFSNRIFLWPRWVWLLIFNWCKESANWIINKYTESDSSYSININSPWIRWVENRHST